MKKDIQKAKELCIEACDEIYINHDVELTYHHFESEVNCFYLFQSDNTNNQSEFHMLEKVEQEIKKINKRWRVGILYNDLEKWEANMLASKVKNKEL